MLMLPTDNILKSSMLEGYVQINGDSILIDSIKKEVRDYIYIGKNLYETQTLMKDFLIQKYGEKWYLESGEAVAYIVENEYSTHFYNLADKIPGMSEKNMRQNIASRIKTKFRKSEFTLRAPYVIALTYYQCWHYYVSYHVGSYKKSKIQKQRAK